MIRARIIAQWSGGSVPPFVALCCELWNLAALLRDGRHWR